MRATPGRLTAAFLLGIACALWLFPVLAGTRIQELRLERDRYRSEAETLQSEILKLKEASSAQQPTPVVKSVAPHIDHPDQRVVLEVEKRLKKDLAVHVGRSIDAVNPVLLYTQFQGHLLKVDGVLFQLDLRFLAVGSEVSLYGRLKKVDGQ